MSEESKPNTRGGWRDAEHQADTAKTNGDKSLGRISSIKAIRLKALPVALGNSLKRLYKDYDDKMETSCRQGENSYVLILDEPIRSILLSYREDLAQAEETIRLLIDRMRSLGLNGQIL